MHSLWTEGIRPVQGRELRGDIRTEVCVIGGGMTGVLCAARLTACGIDNVLLEAGQPGGGITAKTTAVLTAQHDQLYRTLVKRYGLARAGQYLQANLRALSRIRRMAESIDCELETCPSVMYSLTGKDKLREETEIVRRLGFPAEYTTDPGLPFPVADAVVYPDMAQFHPLKFLNGVAAGLRLYTGAFVRRLEGTTAVTDHGRVIAGKVIVDTPCVTGNVNRGTITPTGTYWIEFKRRNYAMPRYGVTVSYWMPIDTSTGVGLHDASWRSTFGGKYYISTGSHGCINLPVSAARTIYNNCFGTMPVVVH